MIALVALGLAQAATLFNCSMSAPAVVSASGLTSMAGMPDSALHFDLELSEREIAIAWPNSPIQLNGRTAWFSAGDSIGSAFFLAHGPCLLTETACGHSVSFARQPDQSLILQIQPTAFLTEESGAKRPFVVVVNGRCTPRGPRR